MNYLLTNHISLYRKNPDRTSRVSQDDYFEDILPLFNLNKIYGNEEVVEKYSKWVMADDFRTPFTLFIPRH